MTKMLHIYNNNRLRFSFAVIIAISYILTCCDNHELMLLYTHAQHYLISILYYWIILAQLYILHSHLQHIHRIASAMSYHTNCTFFGYSSTPLSNFCPRVCLPKILIDYIVAVLTPLFT